MRSLKSSLLMSCLVVGTGVATAYESENVRQLRMMSNGFAEVAAEVKPGVVAIATEGKITRESRSPRFRSNPWEEFFGRPNRPQERRRDGQGSGVIVNFRGDQYIITNNHVVRHAEAIRVELSDSRFFEAEVVGRDSLSDIAVLKIEVQDLPAVQLGDSDALREGEWVLAIGSPMGFVHSVTTGIVSAVGRGRFAREYGSFIQTDAAINPGNSGGAMVNLYGELVGINTAIVSRSGGYMGIGFAIPVNLVQDVMAQLIEYGEVRRGLLGIGIGDLEPLVAEAMGLNNTHGVLVERVFRGKAADKAGVKVDDIVLAVDGVAVRNSTELKSRIGRTAPGVKVELLVLRNGNEKRIDVELGQLDEEVLAAGNPRGGDEKIQGPLGVRVEELTDELARQLGYEDERGVLVSRVAPGSEADRRGLDRGDLIQAINRIEVESVDDYEDLLSAIEPGDAFMMRVWSRDNNSSELVGMRMPIY